MVVEREMFRKELALLNHIYIYAAGIEQALGMERRSYIAACQIRAISNFGRRVLEQI